MINSYLSSKTQHVKIFMILSENRSVSVADPLGSALGLLLFLLYINDLPKATSLLSILSCLKMILHVCLCMDQNTMMNVELKRTIELISVNMHHLNVYET